MAMDLKDKRDIMAAILIKKVMGEKVSFLASDDEEKVKNAVESFNPFIASVYKLVDLMLAEGHGKAD